MTAPLQILRENGSVEIPASTLGLRLSEIRRSRDLTLKELSTRTGIPVSTLSKVQNNQATLSYENLVKLSVGLDVDVGEFFRHHPSELRTTRRTIERKDQGRRGQSERYAFEILATELARKRMVPESSLLPQRRWRRSAGSAGMTARNSSTCCRVRCVFIPSSTNPRRSRPAIAPI
jgi:transcriptional regulator with XRE-family HTH domain